MPNVKISDLPSLSATDAAANDQLVINDTGAGITKRISRSDLYGASNGATYVGYLQSGSGAEPRTVQSKLSDVVSVKDFGAVGDGVTDDTAAIQAAFASGNDIDLVGATYGVSDTTLTLISNLKNGKLLFLDAEQTNHIIDVRANNIRIENVTIDMQSASQGVGLTKSCILLFNVSGVIVDKCRCENISCIGISSVGGYSNTISNNYISKEVADGTYINQAINISDSISIPYDFKIINNTCIKTAISINGAHCLVEGNYVAEWKFGGGITFVSAVAGTYDSYGNHLIKNNICRDGVEFDVNVTYTPGIECSQPKCIIIGNICSGNGGEGIICASYKSLILGNICYNNGQYGESSHAMGIKNRYLSANATGEDCTIVGNVCYDDQVIRTQEYGIYVGPTVVRSRVINNMAQNNITANIVMPNVSYDLQDISSPSSNFGSTLTVSSGSITVVKGFHNVDTEGGAATDNLTTITAGFKGQRVILAGVTVSRVVTIVDGGNLKLNGNFALGSQYQTIELLCDGTNWIEISRSAN